MSRTTATAVAAVLFAIAAMPSTAKAVSAMSWPRTYQANGVKVVVYQPQVKSWNNQTVLDGIAAVALTPNGGSNAVYGTATFTAFTAADYNNGTVTITTPKIVTTHWPDQSQAASAKYDGLLRSTVQLHNNTIPLASLLASISAQQATPKATQINTDPPQIFESEKPAILVVFDGNPILAPIEGTSLKFAVNTNWNVVQDGSRYYLLNSDSWISSPGASGPWSPATAPATFSQIPNNDNFKDIHDHLGAAAPSQVPTVFVSTKPADMILIDGSPKLAAISGTQLSYVSNTDSDLFQYAPTKAWYVLLSGRWFSSSSLNGPWTYAGNNLPADFKKIPVNSPRGRVLISVPNTPEAQYAGASAAAPQIASVDPTNTQLNVAYGPGAPQFEPIQGTSMQYAVNTSYDVIKLADNVYFACYSGIWFHASAPTGPWSVATAVPSVIYTIPPSSPLYQDTFVNIYNNQGQVVVVNDINGPYYTTAAPILFGFTAGYLAGYWWGGGWAYGTGWYYPPYYYPGAVPAYYGYPATYTGGAYYNPSTGTYGRYASAYGPYGGATARAQYNPTTGTYARGGSVYGPNGSAAGGSFYNPRYGVSGHTMQYSSPYGSWGHSSVSGPGGTTYTAHGTNPYGTAAASSGRYGNTAVAKSSTTGDVYAGHDGNVYSNQNGSWQKYNGSTNSWSNVSKPSTSTTNAYHPPSGSTGGFTHPNYTGAGATSNYHPTTMPSSSTMSSLNRDSYARGAGYSGGFHGFSGGGGGFRGR